MNRLYSMVLPIARHLGGDAQDTVRDIHTDLQGCVEDYVGRIRHDLRLFSEATAGDEKAMAQVDANISARADVSYEIGYLRHLSGMAKRDAVFCVYHIKDVCETGRTKLNEIVPIKVAYRSALREKRIKKVSSVEVLVEEAVPDHRALRNAIAHEGERMSNYDANAAPAHMMGMAMGTNPIAVNGVQQGNAIAFSHKNRIVSFKLNADLPERMEAVILSVLDVMQPYADLHGLDTGWDGPRR